MQESSVPAARVQPTWAQFRPPVLWPRVLAYASNRRILAYSEGIPVNRGSWRVCPAALFGAILQPWNSKPSRPGLRLVQPPMREAVRHREGVKIESIHFAVILRRRPRVSYTRNGWPTTKRVFAPRPPRTSRSITLLPEEERATTYVRLCLRSRNLLARRDRQAGVPSAWFRSSSRSCEARVIRIARSRPALKGRSLP